MFVLGTAGHVDHGKSTLVKALTGIDPDRWAEEQRRQMTIDLGFAWLTLPDGRPISLVDVPGHERFIKNMLAGVGGIHGVLLIVAADESIMPQTREHIAILDLLDMRHGIVVVTKADLVDDEWLSLVHDEIREALAPTSLAAAPHVAVSARTGAGIDRLRSQLSSLIQTIAPSPAAARGPRLSIDRSFTIGGFGTVVTGTLVDGTLSVGDDVEILPSALRARVRGIQTHRQAAEAARPGQRVAVNLSGIHHLEVRRGDLLVQPGTLQPTDRIDVQLRLTTDAPPLHQNDALDLFVGAAEARCRITLLDSDEVAPGDSAWAQLRLNAPLALVAGDRIILRVPSPSQTVAGGRVIDPHPVRHRRFRREVIDALAARARGEPTDLLLAALQAEQPLAWSALTQTIGLPAQLALTARTELATAGRIQVLHSDSDDPFVIEREPFEQLRRSAATAVDGYHQRWPLRRGMPREELRRRLKLSARQLNALLPALHETLDADELSVRRSSFAPEPDAHGRLSVERYLRDARRTPFAAPTPDMDDELRNWMLDRQLIVRLAEDAYLLPQDYQTCLDWITERLRAGLTVSVAEVRDRFATSRRYALALLEYLDERRITRRVGDTRVAGDTLR